ncbi:MULTISPECIES: BREX-1 system adenine-specific DNA-methyltransferase PglX [Desulfovibrio]|uniref:site-specific DNA-methyltransferase (adenine-specific) n=1 Tax=Desulfovibrio desulfuricans TaxID=876 RepID=A0AA94L2L4_DESDE|nr:MULTISPECIES: BREX-1 system adenine-specific DNA-methyltransferase PglX [Desulfovibrio]ATD82495.1 class I SAM-dependent DNA methyltransferase [Desulfovibrio sp. G11]SFW56073.1 Type II restriction/modification system, DNA methylase subunit YeeA [Desulfovibrio desulfuricans]SPD35292.1 Restriction modification methylase Eco57I [Desulfovibrio sp. G11]
METLKLKRFAQYARRSLLEQVSGKLKLVLTAESSARREHDAAVKKLEEAIQKTDKEHVIERVAYIWFNRFCALRFMDVNRYTRIGVVSPAEGQFQPEILAEAKMGHIDEEMVHDKVRQQIFALLDGKAPSRDPQGEAYRLLVVAACNFWNKAMPFLFQRIDDYTQLLMPDDLLSGNSILAYTREAMTPDACEDVEVIGWLYQFYISEKKDEVFDGLKKNKKITPENIPAATQLFTPHWIVRYLVENSLGRLWLLNRPGSKLIEQMDYYIKPEQPETDFLRISKPEQINICDPACGSGHMLTYAFDLLYAIYEEEGYEPAEIPEKILTNNLYGIEIDERAGELAAFALTMKARAKQRRFFNKGVKPNICVLENVHFDGNELKDYMDFVGRDLFTAPLQTTLRQFEEADNFGSLIRPDVTDVDGMLRVLESKNVSGQLFISMTHQKVLQALRQADYLSPKYHVVIANPPYMGGKGMNGRLAAWAKDNFPNSKSDLFAMFVERNLDLAQMHGVVAMITMQSWMFLSSFEALRTRLLGQNTLLSMAHLGARAFDSIGGEVVSTTAFVLENANRLDFKGSYLRLVSGNSEIEKNDAIREAVRDPDCGWLFRSSAADFKKIPGSPIAYWVSDKAMASFSWAKRVDNSFELIQGMITGDNAKYVRFWYEISSRYFSIFSQDKNYWVPYNKGGEARKWYGNHDLVVDWRSRGEGFTRNRSTNSHLYFRPYASWSYLNTGSPAARYYPDGFLWDVHGSGAFPRKIGDEKKLVALLCSKAGGYLLNVVNPTMSFQVENISALPWDLDKLSRLESSKLLRTIELSQNDWNSYETSWDFTILPLLNPDYRQPTLKATYQKLHAHLQEVTLEMQRLEEENNRIFIEAYGLQDELTPEVPHNEITLTSNPHYRYGNDKSEDELEALLLADTMRELVSYAVGCMFGRYALDKPGLILANQGETIEDYLKQVPEPSFPADDDNVIPMLDDDWFTDDIAERFRKFLRAAFGEEHYEANLKFVEKALGKNGKARDIRDYFLKDFYSDHVKRYKKRPIYWLFSSPRGSFNALIYMHRYRPDTVSVVLNDYLREFRTKLTSHKNHLEAVSISGSASQGEKTKALKEIEKITKMIAELEDYEREVLYPLATEQVEIDLDDGVKVNYPKLGAALKKIVGLDAKED